MCIVSLAVVRINSLHIRYQLRLLAIASITQFILRYGSIVLKSTTLGAQLSYFEFSISYKNDIKPSAANTSSVTSFYSLSIPYRVVLFQVWTRRVQEPCCFVDMVRRHEFPAACHLLINLVLFNLFTNYNIWRVQLWCHTRSRLHYFCGYLAVESQS